MKKYKAGSYKQAAAIARRSVGWSDLERFALKEIAEGKLLAGRFGKHTIYWCDVHDLGFLFLQDFGDIEISRIYTK